jgi:hypothetical protein
MTREQRMEKQAFVNRTKALEKLFQKIKPILEEQRQKYVSPIAIKIANKCFPQAYFDMAMKFLSHVPPSWFGQWIPRLLFVVWSFRGPAEIKYLIALPLTIIEPFIIMIGLIACMVRLCLYYTLVAPWYRIKKLLLVYGTSFKLFEREDGKAITVKVWHRGKEVFSLTLDI